MLMLRPKSVIPIWTAGADHPTAEQRQQTQSRTLLKCVGSLGELIEDKHATCILAIRPDKLEAEAAAAHKESLTFLGTMVAASDLRRPRCQMSARRTADLRRCTWPQSFA